MERLKLFSLLILVLTISNFSFEHNSFAQKRTYQKKNYYFSYDNSSSLKSSAANLEFHKNITKKNYYSDYNNSDRRINSDKYLYEEKDYNKYERKISENYFRIDESGNSLWDGKHWEQSDFPLNIYVKEISSRYYKSVYKDYVRYAMDVWRKADDRIEYKFVKNIVDADIALVFVENLGDEYEENYLGLTKYDTNRNKQIEFSKIQISLVKNGNEKISAGEIKATVIHEIGHALGLGHSENENDLMYPYISSDHSSEMTYNELSSGDKLAVKDVIDLSFEEEYVWK